MGTHPIFESDFDCLTDVRKSLDVFEMGVFHWLLDIFLIFVLTLEFERQKDVRAKNSEKFLELRRVNKELTDENKNLKNENFENRKIEQKIHETIQRNNHGWTQILKNYENYNTRQDEVNTRHT